MIGHSLGGAAAALALNRGLKAERAILIAPAADPVDAGYRFAHFVGMAEYLCQRMFDMFAGAPGHQLRGAAGAARGAARSVGPR